MQKVILPLAALLILLTLGCDKHFVTMPGLSGERVQYDNLSIGQKTRYVRFKVGSCFSSNTNQQLQYLSDTLTLEVIDYQSDTFILKESLSAHSLSVVNRDTTDALYDPADKTIKITVKDQIVQAHNNQGFDLNVSRIFSRVPLSLVKNELRFVKMEKWYPDPSNYSQDKGFLLNYSQLGEIYPHLNYALYYSPMYADGPGLFYLYSKEYGIVRSAARNGWCNEYGGGWDLLPE